MGRGLRAQIPRFIWRFMGTSNPNDKSTYNLLRGLRGLIGTDWISTLSLQEG